MLQFWWSANEEQKSIHWCSQSKLARRKDQDGLGFRDFEVFNLAMLTKQAWNLLVISGSLHARVFRGLYFPYLMCAMQNAPL